MKLKKLKWDDNDYIMFGNLLGNYPEMANYKGDRTKMVPDLFSHEIISVGIYGMIRCYYRITPAVDKNIQLYYTATCTMNDMVIPQIVHSVEEGKQVIEEKRKEFFEELFKSLSNIIEKE